MIDLTKDNYLLMDCLAGLKELPAESIDMMLTDPPYGNNNEDGDLYSGMMKDQQKKKEARPIANDAPDEMKRVVKGMLVEAARMLKRTSSIVVFCSGGGGDTGEGRNEEEDVSDWLARNMSLDGLRKYHVLIWDKKNLGLGWRYRRQYEMAIVGRRMDGKIKWPNKHAAQPNIFRIAKPASAWHPNQKPVEMLKRLIELHTEPGDIICDPFAGGGSVALAARATGRRFLCFELDKKYHDEAMSRLMLKMPKGVMSFLGDR